MLPSLNNLEIGRLRMSVGYGTHKKGRPLSPVEAGQLMKRTLDAGASMSECAQILNITESNIQRFLNVYTRLPEDLRHLVYWGRSSLGTIGFTTAVEVARLEQADDQRAVATAILERDLQTDEVRQVAQLRRRSERPIEECLNEIIGMRPVVERRYVFIGAVGVELRGALGEMTQAERNRLFADCLAEIDFTHGAGNLGEQLFTLVGDEHFNEQLERQGKKRLEATLRSCLAEKLGGAGTGG